MAERRRTGGTAGVAIALSLAVAAVAPAEDAPVHQLYAARCAFCHGDAGGGDGLAGEGLDPPPTNFTRPQFWQGRTDRQVRDAIRNGKPGTAMVPFGGVLSAGEIDALAPYLRSFADGEPTGATGSRGAGPAPSPTAGNDRRDPR